MMSLNSVLLAAIVVGASASVLTPRDAALDDCAQAVARPKYARALVSSAIADCSSNVVSYTVVTVTVTPDASTFTQTTQIQETALATTTATSTEDVTGTSYVLSTEFDEQTATVYSTSAEVYRLTVPTVYTPPAITATSVISITSQTTSTITSYYPTVTPVVVVPVKRNLFEEAKAIEARNLEASEDDDEVCEIWVEEVWVDDLPETTSSMSIKPTSSAPFYASNSTSSASATPTSLIPVYSNSTSSIPYAANSTATTSIAQTSTIPAYASACTSWAEYVTACSSAGVSQITSIVSVTLEAETITVLAPSTSTLTLVETSSTVVYQDFTTFQTLATSTTESITVTVPVTTTILSTIYQTSTAAASTSYVYQTVTVAAPSASLQTVTAPIRTFKLLMTPAGGSAANSLYMVTGVGDGLAFKSTTDVTLASVFTLDTLNRLVTTAADPQIACAYNALPAYYMESIRHTWLAAHSTSYTPLTCAVNSDLTLTCTYKTSTYFTYYPSQASFFYSTSGYEGFTNYVAHLILQ